ncbi:DUF1801 domain-containing protein [Qipengyuania sp. SM2507]
MSENKTKPTGDDVETLIAAIADPQRRADAEEVCTMLARASGEIPQVWRGNMVGFGTYRYRYDSGREGEWFITGFASRAASLTLYIMSGFPQYQGLMDRLGKHKTGKSCLYIKRLADVDGAVLEELVTRSVAHMRATHETLGAGET